jgi:hypothetical protein
MYDIICNKEGKWLAASGFYSIERAQAWIDKFDANFYMDKTLLKSDFEIIEKTKKPKE